ncbi:DUF1700 domain-containing protein [Janthinobacterium agaricidamnosum]|uniref:Transmembrane protein n=1 Tax=Janthinobacterium agaricidamnosum NBRC 102515 = DSM 9628 TaxID=1349767 RepID=W0V6P3_9BURK|nr:DUF1700 domain-containing protein [Janthinobacterium agaricidamnosum]CDG83013.1 hypothetical protein GJA_2379 [Janthinobacterium agaricidamnosum NBRC 102515 = DSM 9628]
MSKLEYIAALRGALAGLPPDIIARTLAYYEQRFVDGQAVGRSEEDIARELGDPKKIALTLRTNSHMKAFEHKKTPFNLLRLLASLIGLAIFNLFMVVPALVYAALLAALYAAALGFYVAGIAITASGLSGANELVLEGPLRHWIAIDDNDSDDQARQTRISISENGINIYQEPVPRDKAAPVAEDDDEQQASPSRVIRQAEKLAGGVRVSTDLEQGSRSTQALFGLGMVIAGILLFLLSLVVSHYTLLGIKRYIAMNVSMLKGH